MAKEDKISREFTPIGKYRIRILETDKGPLLDIREYIKDDRFEGYTRRGIRLTIPQDTDALRHVVYELPSAPEPSKSKTRSRT